MWGDAMQVIQNCLPRRPTSPRPTPTRSTASDRRARRSPGMSFDAAPRRCRRRASPWPTAATVDSSYSADTVAYTSPGGGSQASSGSTVTIYGSDGSPAPPPKQHRSPVAEQARRWQRRPQRRARARLGPRRRGAAVRDGAAPSGSGSWPSGLDRSAQLAAYLRGDGAAVGAALAPGAGRRPSPCPSPACPRRRRRSASIAAVTSSAICGRVELLGQVVGDHLRLGPLLVGHLGAAAVVERGRGLAALLGLGARARR